MVESASCSSSRPANCCTLSCDSVIVGLLNVALVKLLGLSCADEESADKESANAHPGRKQKAMVPALQLPGLYKSKKAAFDADMDGFSDSDAELPKPQKVQAGMPSSKTPKPAKALRPDGAKDLAKADKQAAKRKPAESGPQGQRKSSVQGRRSLPGRLRKKLAKQRET